MTWLTDNRTDTTIENTDNIWLKFEPIQNVGDFSQITMRILGGDPSNLSEPAGIWTHWLNNKPFNCAGFDDCPVCAARKIAMQDDPINYKKKFQLSYKYFFNVAVDEGGPKVKIFSFGSGLGKKLKGFEGEYGDLRDYDIKVRKTKTGSLQQNVEYDPFYVGHKAMFTKEQLESLVLHDLKPYVQPATPDHLTAVARGETPDANIAQVSESPSTSSLLVQLEDIAAKRQMTLSDLEVDTNTSQKRLEELISLLDVK